MLLLQHEPLWINSEDTRYLMAKVCSDLQYHEEAIHALLGGMTEGESGKRHISELLGHVLVSRSSQTQTNSPRLSQDLLQNIPKGAAGLYLLGNLCRSTHRNELAKECYRRALEQDPCLFCAFMALAELGVPSHGNTSDESKLDETKLDNKDELLDIKEIFGVSLPKPPPIVQPSKLTIPKNDNTTRVFSGAFNTKSSTLPTPAKGQSLHSAFTSPYSLTQQSKPASALNISSLSVTTPHGIDSQRGSSHVSGGALSSSRGPTALFTSPNMTPIPHLQENHHEICTPTATPFVAPPPSILRPVQTASAVAARLYYQPSPEAKVPPRRVRFSSFCKDDDSAKQMDDLEAQSSVSIKISKGRRLFKNAPHKKKSSTEADGTKKDIAATKYDSVHDESSNEDAGIPIILALLATLGQAYLHLCQYECFEALNVFRVFVPPDHYNTGWVLHQVGKAHFEMLQYRKALSVLKHMTYLEPYRMQGLELLSTLLWHLKEDVELSTLAQRVTEQDPNSPECWCVVGNCFSLQKDHETALSFFQRAIQLDEHFTYAHTLCGHEYVSNEDLDQAAVCYRRAIQIDERHYNAWYGLGAIFYRQEKHELAEYHFCRALRIHPRSSVLLCHLGMVQHANHKTPQALQTLEQAFALDPKNSQARYQKATLLISQGMYVEALAELEKVRDCAPRESSVYFAMGKVCKALGKTERALNCFVTALDLDPKDNNLIKAAMDRLDQPDVDEDVSMF